MLCLAFFMRIMNLGLTMAKSDEVGKWVTISERAVKLLENPLTLPLVIVAGLFFAIYSWGPPVVQGHLDVLKTTQDTLKSMDATMQQSNIILESQNSILDKLVNQSYPAEDFRQLVHDEHMKAQKKIDEIHEVVTTQ